MNIKNMGPSRQKQDEENRKQMMWERRLSELGARGLLGQYAFDDLERLKLFLREVGGQRRILAPPIVRWAVEGDAVKVLFTGLYERERPNEDWQPPEAKDASH